jgi:small subunit ribosomal protein S8
MSMNDPIADMLTRIRNGIQAKKKRVDVRSSKMAAALAEILLREKYLSDVKVVGEGTEKVLRVFLKYSPDEKSVVSGIRRVSSPGRRIYAGSERLPRVQGGLGTVIVSTPRGLMTHKECRREHVGGEVICTIW